MEDQKQLEARWRESLELLGLPIDTPPPGARSEPAPRPVPPSAPEAPPVAKASPPPLEHEPMPDAMEDGPSDTEVVFEEVPEFTDEDPRGEEPALDGAEEAGEEPEGQAGAESAPGDDDKPRRGRRRRRRGRRRGGDKEEAVKSETGEPVAPPKPAERRPQREAPPSRPHDARDRGPARGPRRDDRRDAPAPVRNETPRDRWEEEQPTEAVETFDETKRLPTDSDEPDLLSDWDVPAWPDLIASLYRPER